MLEIDLLEHEEVEEMAQSQVLWLISLDQFEAEWLKEEAAIDDVTRTHIVSVSLDEIRLHRVELHRDAGWRLIAKQIEFDLVPFEFAFDHFGHFDPLAFQ